jgi:hypothetical protein
MGRNMWVNWKNKSEGKRSELKPKGRRDRNEDRAKK